MWDDLRFRNSNLPIDRTEYQFNIESNNLNCGDKSSMFKNGGRHFTLNSLLPKKEEIRYLAKLTNASAIRISEAKLDGSALSNEVATEGYDFIRIDRSRKRDGVACFIKHSALTVIKPICVLTRKVFSQRYIYPNENYSRYPL